MLRTKGKPTQHLGPTYGWEGQDDPLNLANQSVKRKLFMTFLVSLIALSVSAASAIDACGVKEYSENFQVSEVVGSLATGMIKSLCNRASHKS